ncbi:hypothetical protein SDC9_205865 [bioreactor metagenome]|uniref:Uncharacterized protein n=1 Tax=bioreactor metagenome TaxID=1076179 RepID=A0A645JCN5_9ZZZZ
MGKLITDDKIYNTFNFWIGIIVILTAIVMVCIVLNDLFRTLTKCINIIRPYKFRNLYISTIISPKSNSTIQHKLHVASTTCFFRSQ